MKRKEEILSQILMKHQNLSLLILCKNQIFPQISVQRILKLIIEEISEEIK